MRCETKNFDILRLCAGESATTENGSSCFHEHLFETRDRPYAASDHFGTADPDWLKAGYRRNNNNERGIKESFNVKRSSFFKWLPNFPVNSTIAQSSFKGKIWLAICACEKTFVKESEYSISLNRNYRDDQFKITMKSLSDVAVNFCF